MKTAHLLKNFLLSNFFFWWLQCLSSSLSGGGKREKGWKQSFCSRYSGVCLCEMSDSVISLSRNICLCDKALLPGRIGRILNCRPGGGWNVGEFGVTVTIFMCGVVVTVVIVAFDY